NLVSDPLALVIYKAHGVLDDAPGDALARNELDYLDPGIVHGFIVEDELAIQHVGRALDVLRPPSADIVDGLERFIRRLSKRKGRRKVSTLNGTATAVLSRQRNLGLPGPLHVILHFSPSRVAPSPSLASR